MTNLQYALSYADRGWRVLPLHTPDETGECSCNGSDCASPGKHPRTLNGVHDATTDEADVRKWWERLWPEANIGIACGQESGLVVLDMDPRNGGVQSVNQVEEEYDNATQTFLETVSAITGGGGRHWYWQYPEARIGKSVLDGGLDLVSDGGYVVAPPSLHPAGSRYRWASSGGGGVRALQPMPSWVRDLREDDARGRGFSLPSASELEQFTKGKRNIMLTRVAGAMRRWGMSERAIVAGLQVHNRETCQPPLPEHEVRNIAESVSRYEPGVSIGEDEPPQGCSISITSS